MVFGQASGRGRCCAPAIPQEARAIHEVRGGDHGFGFNLVPTDAEEHGVTISLLKGCEYLTLVYELRVVPKEKALETAHLKDAVHP